MEPEAIDSPASRAFSRLTCIYGLQDAKRAALNPLEGPETFLELGRFHCHYATVGDEMPRFTKPRSWTAPRLETSRGSIDGVREAQARIGIVPHSGVALVVWLDIEVTLVEAIIFLQETCFRRTKLLIDGTPLIEVMRDVSPELDAGLEQAAFDREVHQVFAPSSSLLATFHTEKAGVAEFDPDSLLRLVYRENEAFRLESSAMSYPKELNRPVGSICAHGRGVTVLGGAADHVENGIVLTALELVTSTGRLRLVRARALKALETASEQGKPDDRATRIADLARRLRDLDLDLSFGVDRFLDSLRVPEIVLGAYRSSLSGVLELRAGAEATARMVERLQRVIAARQLELETAQEAVAEARRRSAGITLGYFTVIALPIGAILAFLGANVSEIDGQRSVWALDYYGLYYLLFLGIMAFGAVIYIAARRLLRPTNA